MLGTVQDSFDSFCIPAVYIQRWMKQVHHAVDGSNVALPMCHSGGVSLPSNLGALVPAYVCLPTTVSVTSYGIFLSVSGPEFSVSGCYSPNRRKQAPAAIHLCMPVSGHRPSLVRQHTSMLPMKAVCSSTGRHPGRNALLEDAC